MECRDRMRCMLHCPFDLFSNAGNADGKPAGVRCIHLLDDYRCAIYNDPSKPKVCSDFKAEPEFCGSDREEAMRILFSLSKESH